MRNKHARFNVKYCGTDISYFYKNFYKYDNTSDTFENWQNFVDKMVESGQNPEDAAMMWLCFDIPNQLKETP